jgi:LmbE family N-acetylglucosaminyl deacetylase
LVIAPHPDDEVLGVGGTIARLADEGVEVTVVILTRGYPPQYSEEELRVNRAQAAHAHALLQVKETLFLDFPAAALDSVEHRILNKSLGDIFERVSPEYMFIPFAGDIHLDHQIAFRSALVACRPHGGHAPKAVFAYETLSETNWNAPFITPGFIPNTFFDISSYLERKLQAFACYANQVRKFPNERSPETLRALAMLRGSTVSLPAAEAFIAIRQVL